MFLLLFRICHNCCCKAMDGDDSFYTFIYRNNCHLNVEIGQY